MTPIAYAKNEIKNGRFPMIVISGGEYGTYWLHDADWRMLDCRAFNSKEAAEKFRSKTLDKAAKVIN